MDLAFIDKILNRQSIRFFSDKVVDRATLDILLNCARAAPTSGMAQSWSVLVISDPELKRNLIENNRCIGNRDGMNVTMIKKSSYLLIWLADQHRNKIILENSNYTLPPNEMHSANLNLKSICDATIAAQTFCLAAESIGLGTCYMGTMREVPIDYWKTNFGLPDYVFPIFGTVIGYPNIASSLYKPNRERLPLDITVHHNRYTIVNNVNEYNKTFIKNKSRFSSFEELLENRLCEKSQGKQGVADSLKKAGFKFE